MIELPQAHQDLPLAFLLMPEVPDHHIHQYTHKNCQSPKCYQRTPQFIRSKHTVHGYTPIDHNVTTNHQVNQILIIITDIVTVKYHHLHCTIIDVNCLDQLDYCPPVCLITITTIVANKEFVSHLNQF